MGAERRSMAMSEEEKTLTAYHEAGHAIVGRVVPEHDPVYKVTIIPRGRALGVTMYLPEGDKYSLNRVAIESQLCSLYGGRVAEELIFGADKVTTGASNDIERATKMARNMVTKWGLSDEMGPIAYGEEEDEVFLGRSVTQHKNVSNETARRIDEVVRAILDRAYARTKTILTENLDKLHTMSHLLRDHRRAADRRHHGRPRAAAADGLEQGGQGRRQARVPPAAADRWPGRADLRRVASMTTKGQTRVWPFFFPAHVRHLAPARLRRPHPQARPPAGHGHRQRHSGFVLRRWRA
jgi:hypothetical protein